MRERGRGRRVGWSHVLDASAGREQERPFERALREDPMSGLAFNASLADLARQLVFEEVFPRQHLAQHFYEVSTPLCM